MVFLFLLCGNVLAAPVTFTDTKYLSAYLYGTDNEYTWQHAVTSDFSVPYDTVNSATLTISGRGIGGANDNLYVESTWQGVLNGNSTSHLTWYLDKSTTTLDIADIFVTWTAGDKLDIKLNYNDTTGGFLLTKSVFTLNYNNGQAPTVPIPGTLLMLGTALIGLLGVRRRIPTN